MGGEEGCDEGWRGRRRKVGCWEQWERKSEVFPPEFSHRLSGERALQVLVRSSCTSRSKTYRARPCRAKPCRARPCRAVGASGAVGGGNTRHLTASCLSHDLKPPQQKHQEPLCKQTCMAHARRSHAQKQQRLRDKQRLSLLQFLHSSSLHFLRGETSQEDSCL